MAVHSYGPLVPAIAPKKVRISILLDEDILEHFKQRAAQRNALPYQTQINRVLRSAMLRERGVRVEVDNGQQALLEDTAFIRAVAKRVQKETKPLTKARRKVA